jgi:hypothetical protein
MKILRYVDSTGAIHYGAETPEGPVVRIVGDIFGAYAVTGEEADVVRRLAPVAPAQIIGIGLNYRQHAAETNARVPDRPIVFFKALGTLCHPDEPIFLPTHLPSEEVDYEGELAVVICRACKNVRPENALDHVLGYACANDVSARDHQMKLGGGQWSRGKSFDTFAPLGPCLVTTDEIPNPNVLAISTALNGGTVQHGGYDFFGGGNHCLPQWQHHSGARHGDLHRHAGRRRHGSQAGAALAAAGGLCRGHHRKHRHPSQPGCGGEVLRADRHDKAGETAHLAGGDGDPRLHPIRAKVPIGIGLPDAERPGEGCP